MAKSRSLQNVKLNSFEDLFGGEPLQGDVVELPLCEMFPFKGHPFKVLENADMEALVESIRLHGKVLQPVLVRPREAGGYELISGHRRTHAAGVVGLSTVPAIVRELDNDEATVIMVDSNLHREELLPSEKAFAYKMKFEALSHPGSRIHGRAANAIADEAGESVRSVQRYIRLTKLVPELLDLVDDGKLPVYTAAELSYLGEAEQRLLYAKLAQGGNGGKGAKVSNAQAMELKKLSQRGELGEAEVERVMKGSPSAAFAGGAREAEVERVMKGSPSAAFTGGARESVIAVPGSAGTCEPTVKLDGTPDGLLLPSDLLAPYFPVGTPAATIRTTIITLLDAWKEGQAHG